MASRSVTLHGVGCVALAPSPWPAALAALMPIPHPARPPTKQEDFQQVVKATGGFKYRALTPDALDFARQKWGYIGTQPGVRGLPSSRASCLASGMRNRSVGPNANTRCISCAYNLGCAGDWAELELDTALDPTHPNGHTMLCKWQRCRASQRAAVPWGGCGPGRFSGNASCCPALRFQVQVKDAGGRHMLSPFSPPCMCCLPALQT